MKFDKHNLRHWIYLLITTANIFISLPFRLFKPRKPIIILYGHKLNGNLIAFYEYMEREHGKEFDMYYLTMDRKYFKEVKQNFRSLSSENPIHMIKVARSSAFITDHGLHSLIIYHKLTSIKFFDTWHGIPYKGFDEEDMKALHNYTQTWVTSKSMQKIYINKYGFDKSRVKVTGYARVDAMAANTYDKKDLLRKYGVEGDYKARILIAPTWKQDDQGRSIFPFDTDAKTFLGKLNDMAMKNNALVMFRAHLNSKDKMDVKLDRVRFFSFDKYPVTEEILYITDILVSDWSSIAFDFLVMRRPTIFLEVKPPFAKGFTYDASYRFGEVVKNMDELTDSLATYVKKPQQFDTKYGKLMEKVSNEVYDLNTDGRSAERYYKCLVKALDEQNKS